MHVTGQRKVLFHTSRISIEGWTIAKVLNRRSQVSIQGLIIAKVLNCTSQLAQRARAHLWSAACYPVPALVAQDERPGLLRVQADPLCLVAPVETHGGEQLREDLLPPALGGYHEGARRHRRCIPHLSQMPARCCETVEGCTGSRTLQTRIISA